MTTAAERITAAVAAWARACSGVLAVGVCGAQGSGKSTACAEVEAALGRAGLPTVTLSLDDYCLSRAARQDLARARHPLFAVRGPPGTHDVDALAAAIDALKAAEPLRLRRFSKAHDDVAPEADWPYHAAPVRVVLVEGWCVGARAGRFSADPDPINPLEREEDADGHWRAAVHAALAGPYQALWAKLDRLILLAAPGFEVVQAWREQQERTTAAAADPSASRLMSPPEIARFIQYYERLTRAILADMPAYADLTLKLDPARQLID